MESQYRIYVVVLKEKVMMKRMSVFLLILVCAAFAFAQTPEAMIREMTGTVELKIGGSGDWVAAKTGDRLEKSTVISTSFKSTALLAVGNTTLMVRPLTRLSLEEIMSEEGTETLAVGLSSGRVRVEAKPPAGNRMNITVQAPMALASVRGTTFNIDPLNISVEEGLIKYAGIIGRGQAVKVGAGQVSMINEFGNAVNPLDLAEMDLLLADMAGWAATNPYMYESGGVGTPDLTLTGSGSVDNILFRPAGDMIEIKITITPK